MILSVAVANVLVCLQAFSRDSVTTTGTTATETLRMGTMAAGEDPGEV